MKTSLCAITLSALSALAGTALAQPGTDVYESGILHQPVGGAVLGPVNGRRLPVNNLGSSGQDGVEIQLRSTFGGMTGIDLGPVIATPGAELKIKHRGWDGLIYGNHRMINNGGGQFTDEYDFSAIGAPTINVERRDASGHTISVITYPGPIVAIPWVPDWSCSDGSVPVYYERWVTLCNTCSPVLVQGWACPNSGGVFSFNGMSRIIVTPGTGPGQPPMPPLGAMEVTASGISSLDVYDAALMTFGLPCWGVGQAQISEECTPDAATGVCDETVRRLPVTNIGSSGQDGVEIDLGDNAGGVSVEMARGNCCRGHVTLMKLTDDEGQEQQIFKTLVDILPDGSTVDQLGADFSALGSPGWVLTCLDAGGVVVGPSGGTDVINGGPQPICTGRCPEGIETWVNVGTTQNPVWQFQGCGGSMNMTLPNGTVLTGVASYTITPMGPTHQGRLRHVVITKNGSELELRNVVVTPAPRVCTADFNGDGNLGTDQDIADFFSCLGGSCCPTCGTADFNGDGDIGTDGDIASFFRVLAGGAC